jgi:GGDEF domain-containing protein
MRGAFAKAYAVVALLFFIGVLVYVVMDLNRARLQNEREAGRQLESLTTQIERSSAAAGSYAPQTVQMVIQNFRSSSLQAFASYAADGETDYLFSRSQEYLAADPGSTRGARRFTRNPITEARLVQSFTLPNGGSRLGEAVYTALFRRDVYGVLRNALFAVVAFTLLSTIITISTIIFGRSPASQRRQAHATASTTGHDAGFQPSQDLPDIGPEPAATYERPSEPWAEQPSVSSAPPSDAGSDETASGYTPSPQAAQEAATTHHPAPQPESAQLHASGERAPEEPSAAAPEDAPREGLFSSETGLSFREHLKPRLALELERSAYNDQDLAVILLRFPDIPRADDSYARAARALIRSFGFEDLSFEYGQDGFCVILPNTDLNQAIRSAEEFRGKIRRNLSDLPPPLFGITARSGRLVEANRVLTEAQNALERASTDSGRIVGFRPDPQKYRQFLAEHGQD